MQLSDTMAALPEGWSLVEVGEGFALGRYRTSDGSIDLSCYELAEGIILTDIDLACPTLPAFNPSGTCCHRQLVRFGPLRDGLWRPGQLCGGRGHALRLVRNGQGVRVPHGTLPGLRKRAFKTISVVAVVFWALSYSASGVIDDSMMYSIGTFLEPVSRFFGMGWKLFMAFLAGILAKEAVLGALAALFGSASGTMFATVSGAAAAGFSPAVLATQVPAAEALMFNIPCVMVVGATHSETHSTKWTVLISLFYFCLALCICCVVYHVAALVL